MKRVITYGTFDLLHYGHIRLLERAKKLGDYLIVGITSDAYDKTRQKINVQQSLAERIENVRNTGIADQIIVEEYEGQKIDDIKRYAVDIFTVGSDWVGKFDYLNEYCEVKYLERTEGISSTKIRSDERQLTMGIVGDDVDYINKFQSEDKYVNGIIINGICTNNLERMSDNIKKLPIVTSNYSELIDNVEAVYIKSEVKERYKQILMALNAGKHVLCETPICETKEQCKELFEIARNKKLVLMEAVRTAYSTAYSRLLLLVKTGKIGKVLSIDSTCTTMKNWEKNKISSFKEWGTNALLPIFQVLGTKYNDYKMISHFVDKNETIDAFTKLDLIYDKSVASVKVAEGAKSDGTLIITGTKGYIYVPAPWWKTDYFEVRYEDTNENERFFYQLDGEGIRYELLAFTRAVKDKKQTSYIDENISLEFCKMIDNFNEKRNLYKI